MLYVQPNQWGWTWDSLNTTDTPLAQFGVTVTAHASADTKGSYTNICTTNKGGGAVTTLANASYSMELFLSNTNTAATAKSCLLDIGVDPAGGTSYALVASNIQCGQLDNSGPGAAMMRIVLPVFIPAGASVGARLAGVVGGSTARVAAMYRGLPSRPEAIWYGQGCESVGIATDGSVPANSEGTAITPGDSGAWSAWTSLGTTSHQLGYVSICPQIRNATMALLYYHWELGYGDGTDIVKIVNRYHNYSSTSERTGFFWNPSGNFCNVPQGATLYARATCSGTTDTGWTVAAVGVY